MLFGAFRPIYDKVMHRSYVPTIRLSSLREGAVSPLAPIVQFMTSLRPSRGP